MFTEIKELKQARYYLDFKYSLTSKNELSKIKYSHLIDCLDILKFYNFYNYFAYGQSVLLHDIGRFYEPNFKIENFNHAKYGYNLLKKEFTSNPIVLLPIKYHEDDLEWEKLLFNDIEFLKCSSYDKEKIIKCCKLVRDIDIISNMKALLKDELKSEKINNINKNIVNKLYNGEIAIKEDICNKYDEISYMLCGLNLLSLSKSFKYIKKYKIVNKLIKKQLSMVKDNKELYEFTGKVYEFINMEFKL